MHFYMSMSATCPSVSQQPISQSVNQFTSQSANQTYRKNSSSCIIFKPYEQPRFCIAVVVRDEAAGQRQVLSVQVRKCLFVHTC